ncbi:M1 family aminopeptidase [Ferruginibacter sp.]|nr:T9SS type A sorting domain-containing protein [Ferruginibacter sp.]
MKKHYSLIVLLLLLCKISNAQIKSSNGFTFGNELFLNDQILANQDNAGGEQKILISPEKAAHYKVIESKMAAAANNVQQAMLVPSTGLDYDVKYYRLELRINPDTSIGKYIKGKVTIYFTTQSANFSVVNFDMATALASDSVYYHGVKLAAGNISRATANLIAITLPNIPTSGTLDSVSIFYKGVPPVTAGFSNGTGYVKSTHSTAPVRNYVYTLSEPYSSFSWWPCKSFIVNDKADSMDMIVSTPLGFKTAGNGNLVYEITSATEVRTYWKERYPISAYQVCTAVANYVQYPAVADTVIIGGTKMPYYNYLFPETNTAAAHTSLDRVKLMLTTYSSLYGDYPFKNEKYGNYTFGFGGGMEHNTFSGESSSGVYTAAGNWDILAHELAHQWWGASVTCASWHDIWVNESFADFSEALLLEFAPSIGTTAGNTALSWRASKKTNTLSATAQATYVTDTATILTIFTPSVYIYDRGGMIITMMRTLLGDTKFFQALKNYQSDPALKQGNAFTADVKRHMELASGLNLTTFFNQWIYNRGHANYAAAKWNNSAKTVIIQMGTQTTVSSGLTHFDMPVAVRIQGATPATMDTTIILYDQGGVFYYVNNGVLTPTSSNVGIYNLSFVPTTITFDAFSQVLATATFTKGTVLATDILTFTGNKEGTKANLNWTINDAADYTAFEVERSADGVSFEKIGTVKASDNSGRYDFLFTDYHILAGTGYYRIKVLYADGAFIYSKTVSINNKVDYYYTITPNPAKDFILISGSAAKGTADINIYDATGRMVKKLPKQTFDNSNSLKIAVKELGVGNYFVEIVRPDAEAYTKQIVIIH